MLLKLSNSSHYRHIWNKTLSCNLEVREGTQEASHGICAWERPNVSARTAVTEWAEGHHVQPPLPKNLQQQMLLRRYQKPCKKQFCVFCSQKNLALYHCRNTWSGFLFCFRNIFPVSLDILISHINTLALSGVLLSS